MDDVENCAPACVVSETIKKQLSIGTSQTFTSEDTLQEGQDAVAIDTGFKAWVTVLGAFIALFCTFGQMNTFGTFLFWYASHQLQHLSPSTISWIGSTQLLTFFLSGWPIGRAFDSYGPFPIMSLGTIVLLLSNGMTSIAIKFYQLIVYQGVLLGVGVGMLFYPVLASVSTHFQKYRATALGVVASGSSLGGVVLPIVIRRLLFSIGFGWSVRLLGLLSALGCVVSVLTVHSNHRPSGRSRPWIKISELHDPRFVLLTVGSAFVALGLFIPFLYIIHYAHVNGVAPSSAIYTLAVMNAGGVLGRIVPAFFSDILGRFNFLFPAAFLSGLASVLFWQLSHSVLSIMLFAATYGFFSGAFVSLITPCVAQISPIEEIGTRIGVLYSIISIPSLVGGPIGGILFDVGKGSYGGLITFSGSTVIAGSLFILWAKFKIDPRVSARV